MKKILIALTALAAFGMAQTAQAELSAIYGPVYFTKEKKKHEVKLNFDAPVPGTGVVVISNGSGSDKKSKVSSAEVELNGVEVAEESDFNKNVDELRYDVTLLSSNELEVEIKGCKECELSVTVYGEKAIVRPTPPARDIIPVQ